MALRQRDIRKIIKSQRRRARIERTLGAMLDRVFSPRRAKKHSR